ncbi:MAG: hypothetical protein U0228_24580 [Myxococcaceae bacterium]
MSRRNLIVGAICCVLACTNPPVPDALGASTTCGLAGFTVNSSAAFETSNGLRVMASECPQAGLLGPLTPRCRFVVLWLEQRDRSGERTDAPGTASIFTGAVNADGVFAFNARVDFDQLDVTWFDDRVAIEVHAGSTLDGRFEAPLVGSSRDPL